MQQVILRGALCGAGVGWLTGFCVVLVAITYEPPGSLASWLSFLAFAVFAPICLGAPVGAFIGGLSVVAGSVIGAHTAPREVVPGVLGGALAVPLVISAISGLWFVMIPGLLGAVLLAWWVAHSRARALVPASSAPVVHAPSA